MKSIFSSGAKLFLICAVSAVALGAINSVTEPLIAQRKILELKNALKELTPDAVAGEAQVLADDPVVRTRYPVSEGGDTVGAILELTGSGYGGDMKILARFDIDGTVRAVKLMDNLETPGLGKKAEKPAYMEKFLGTGGARPVPVKKNMLQDADSVTGATITFLGIAKALDRGARYIREESQK